MLAHELTHALQDQSFGLEKFMRAGAASRSREAILRRTTLPPTKSRPRDRRWSKDRRW